jgi:hypothetical protein
MVRRRILPMSKKLILLTRIFVISLIFVYEGTSELGRSVFPPNFFFCKDFCSQFALKMFTRAQLRDDYG